MTEYVYHKYVMYCMILHNKANRQICPACMRMSVNA